MFSDCLLWGICPDTHPDEYVEVIMAVDYDDHNEEL